MLSKVVVSANDRSRVVLFSWRSSAHRHLGKELRGLRAVANQQWHPVYGIIAFKAQSCIIWHLEKPEL